MTSPGSISRRTVLASGVVASTTQMYIAGDPGNADDALYQAVPADLRGTVTVKLRRRRRIRLAGERRRVLRGRFDLVLGVTAASL
jgi:hypothetical protein